MSGSGFALTCRLVTALDRVPPRQQRCLNHRMGVYNVSYSSEESTTTSVSPVSGVGSALSDRMAR
jgi:hypothetical protein